MAYTFRHGDRPLDEFTIQRAVGAGGFGEVYYALSDGGREVALKYLKSNPQIELRGVGHCINLKSPHLVSIFDVKKNASDEYFIIMEYCSGPSLRDLLIAEPNGFGPQKATFFVREIAKGLAYLHDRGIVHRDLKPGNIFYDDGYVKIGDYGLSKFISVSRHSAQTASVGTVHYMAPEIGSGNYSRGVDIYALGVMLYEMLLGKVPFEGSSMGEVLMKHLTTQAEVDHLPHPFGKVIRKALEKDPKDRYATVDEMIDELLAVEDVKQSLAGFSTKSLEGAVRYGAPDPAQSPMPSPNPTPGYARDFNRGRLDLGKPWDPSTAPPLTDRLARKHAKIQHKIDQKLAVLAETHGSERGTRRDRLPSVDPSVPVARKAPRSSFGRRMLLTTILMIGMAVSLGVIMGAKYGRAEFGIASAMTALAMSSGLLLSRKVSGWFNAPYGPSWVDKLLRACCCAPLMAVGCTPLFATRGLTYEGLALWVGLLIVVLLADWSKPYDEPTGEMRFGTALWTALGGLIATAISGGIIADNAESVLLIAAGASGIASLVVQANASLGISRKYTPAVAGRASGTGNESDADEVDAKPSRSAANAPAAVDDDSRRANQVNPVTTARPISGGASVPQPPQRWAITRGFFGLIAFAGMGGVIVLTLIPFLLNETHPDDLTGMIIGNIACFSATIFAVRKMGAEKRPTFWQESLRPFLMMVGMFGAGSCSAGIARHWAMFDDEARVLITIGLVFSTLLLGLSLAFRGGQRRFAPAAFLRHDGSVGGAALVIGDSSAHAAASDELEEAVNSVRGGRES